MTTITVQKGEYEFKIIDHSEEYEGVIIRRHFKIGHAYQDCVNATIFYQNGVGMEGVIPTVMYDEECAKPSLPRSGGSILILKTLLHYIHSQIPSVTLFTFDDMSRIECGTDDEKRQKRHRKRGTHAYPIDLHYFSIAFNGCTWYEKHFNAFQRTKEDHAAYRAGVTAFLKGPLPSWKEMIERAIPTAFIEELEPLFRQSSDHLSFFRSIPAADRCRHARQWLIGYVKKNIDPVFTNTGWVIDVTSMNRQEGGKRQTRKKGRHAYYLPNGIITNRRALGLET